MPSRLFECTDCNSYGKITLKGTEQDVDAIVCCPVCGADISDTEEYEDDE